MKKLSALIALALCITIGGVYATWNYAQGDVSSLSKAFNESMAGTSENTAAGQIAINTDTLSITIDDLVINETGVAGTDHKAEAYFDGYVTVTFTPTVGADDDVVNFGIDTKYNFSILTTLDSWSYEGTVLFDVDETPVSVAKESLTKNADGSFSYKIDAKDISDKITINEFHLPTAEDYNNFRAVLNSGSLQVTVSAE